jgi:hypothetical protein
MVNKRDAEVSIVCLSCHFNVGLFPCHQARGTPLAFSMIHVCLQWQELAWDLSRVAWGLDIRIHGTWDFQLMICQAYASYFTHFYLNHSRCQWWGQWELKTSKYHNFWKVFKNLQSLLPSAKGLSFTFMLSLHLLPLCTV